MRLKNSFVLILIFLFGCDTTFVPRPKGFNRIDLPPHEYVALQDTSIPYTFQVSKQALVIKDSANYAAVKKLYRIVKYPELNCKVHLTYKPIKQNIDTLNSYILEGYRLRDGHDKKAYGFEESYDTTDLGNNVAIFELDGDVPSQFQFMLHDSTNHFIRGALYFPTATKNDSLAPVINYVKDDIRHLINTMDWR